MPATIAGPAWQAAAPAACSNSASHEAFAEAAVAFDRSAIARLSRARIAGLAREELIQLVQNAAIPFLNDETVDRLAFCSRETLERLAYLGRLCCCNRGD